MKLKMCYRGVYYDYKPVICNLNKQQQYFVDHSLDKAQKIQTKFLGKICQKKVIKLAVRRKKTRFLGQRSSHEAPCDAVVPD